MQIKLGKHLRGGAGNEEIVDGSFGAEFDAESADRAQAHARESWDKRIGEVLFGDPGLRA